MQWQANASPNYSKPQLRSVGATLSLLGTPRLGTTGWSLTTQKSPIQHMNSRGCAGNVLTQRKLGALSLVPLLELSPEAAVNLLLAGASDSQEPVSRRGNELLKKT